MFKFEINLQDYHVIALTIASIVISIVGAVAAYNIVAVLHAAH